MKETRYCIWVKSTGEVIADGIYTRRFARFIAIMFKGLKGEKCKVEKYKTDGKVKKLFTKLNYIDIM